MFHRFPNAFMHASIFSSESLIGYKEETFVVTNIIFDTDSVLKTLLILDA